MERWNLEAMLCSVLIGVAIIADALTSIVRLNDTVNNFATHYRRDVARLTICIEDPSAKEGVSVRVEHFAWSNRRDVSIERALVRNTQCEPFS